MNRNDDQLNLSHALFRRRIGNQTRRYKFIASVLLGCTVLGAVVGPLQMVDREEQVAAARYWGASLRVWIADKNADNIEILLPSDGQDVRVPATAYLAQAWAKEPAKKFERWILLGGLIGLIIGILIAYMLMHSIRRQGEQSTGDRVIGGTRLVDETGLAGLLGDRCGEQPLQLGPIPIPANFETRHFACIGTTGSGKTTVLRQMLDSIEARGDSALVYDTSGEFIAHYYDPDRGDIILNPFDKRCAFWSPFDEISHPADADRIAHQLVSETGSYDDDVWLETSRILVANMLRNLWSEGNCSLDALLDALQIKTKEQLKHWLGNTSSARTVPRQHSIDRLRFINM